MPFENIDPSMAIGFYCSSQEDFSIFCASINKVHKNKLRLNSKITGEDANPLFAIQHRSPKYSEYDSEEELNDVVVL